jgi:hypothetical protein
MSQSDYIKYKKINTVLSIDASSNFLPVLNSQDYSDYKEFVLENTIINTKTIYNCITPSGVQVVLNLNKKLSLVQNMGKSLSNCPSFLLCNNTNKRLNRVPLSKVYFTPTPQPLTWNQRKNASYLKNDCKCILNSVKTNTNICNCKIGV